MDIYIVSPNASNNGSEQSIWESIIVQNNVVLMGWEPENKFGKMFSQDVQEGDFILIAQGSNKNKKVLLGGVVSSKSDSKLFENAPRSIFYRKLKNVLNKKILESLDLDFVDSAYGASSQIPAIYKLYPSSNKKDKEIETKILKASSELKQHAMNNDIISLLTFKKQIILQGPPGTGKTRMAKQIAIDLCQSQELTADYVKSLFQPGMTIRSSSGQTEYTVISIKENAINLKLTTGSSYDIPIRDIIKAYKTELWKGGQVSGNDPYRAALAKYISEHFNSGEYKLIQFHPAYSYDDFVRGIVADTSEGVVTYRSINKVFAECAEKAWQNYQDSRKTKEQLSEEQKLDQLIELFREYLEEEIKKNNGKLFLEDTITYLFQVEEDAVRYTGDNWKQVSGQRLLFSDIKKLYLSGAKTRQEIKTNSNISGLAKHHASYFLRVLNLFKDFVKGKTVSVTDNQLVSEKNYVLIIDEINRANLPSVLGELIYGLEYRGEPVESIYEVDGSRSITIPPNLYIIGTMNTADRSVGHIDYAIRRRFAFMDVLPSLEPVHDDAKDNFKLVSSLFVKTPDEALNTGSNLERSECLSLDFRPEDVWIGHSYFLTDKKDEEAKHELKIKMKYEVVPLLKEYVKDGILINEEKVKEVINKISL